MSTLEGAGYLICRLGTELAALPVTHVAETMRPLPVEPLAGAPAFVLGLAVIRGAPTPVVDLVRLLTNRDLAVTRFVVVRAGTRSVALAVQAVVGTRRLDPGTLRELPPLTTAGADHGVNAVGTLDSELLVVLESARILQDAVWRAIDSEVRS